MLKVIGSLIVILSTSTIGFIYSKVFSERIRQIRDMQYALNMLESEVVFKATPVTEAFYEISLCCSKTIKKMFMIMGGLLKEKKVDSILAAFDAALKEVKSDIYLENNEIDVIRNFVQTLGSGDLEAQKRILI